MIARLVARRYLFARSLPTAVNVLTLISVLGIGLAATALVLVLSVFNGFHHLIAQVFDQVDPDLRIEAARGRSLPSADSLTRALSAQPEVAHAVVVFETRAILQYNDHQAIVVLKGVDSTFARASAIRQAVFAGSYQLSDTSGYGRIVVGAGIARQTAVNLLDHFEPMQLFTLAEGADLLGSPEQALRSVGVFPAGVFSIQKEVDESLVLADLATARRLVGTPDATTALELTLSDPAAIEALAVSLRARLGPTYRVLTADELHPTLYQIFRTEKVAGFVILSLMLLLTASTVAGTLTLIVIDKRADMAVLQTLGASRGQLAGIVLTQGVAIGLLASVLGLGLALALGWTQQQWGWLKISGGESFLVDAFPVRLDAADFAYVFATVMTMAVLASLPPALRVSRDTVVGALRS